MFIPQSPRNLLPLSHRQASLRHRSACSSLILPPSRSKVSAPVGIAPSAQACANCRGEHVGRSLGFRPDRARPDSRHPSQPPCSSHFSPRLSSSSPASWLQSRASCAPARATRNAREGPGPCASGSRDRPGPGGTHPILCGRNTYNNLFTSKPSRGCRTSKPLLENDRTSFLIRTYNLPSPLSASSIITNP